MVEYYKEKVKTNLELLKVVASGLTILVLIFGNLILKDNFGSIQNHYLLFTGCIILIVILTVIILKYTLVF